MPAFTASPQIIDGKDDDFCGVPAMVFALDNAAVLDAPGVSFPEVVTARIGWDQAGLHVHVHVDDPSLVPSSTPDLWEGDAVELFIAGTSSLTGHFDGTDDGGAIQIVVSAPTADIPSKASYDYAGNGMLDLPYDPSLSAGRVVPGGYEVEVSVPWSSLKDMLAPGSAIGFDLALDVIDNPAAASREQQGLMGFRTVAETSCVNTAPHPSCDDRTWCLPTLE